MDILTNNDESRTNNASANKTTVAPTAAISSHNYGLVQSNESNDRINNSTETHEKQEVSNSTNSSENVSLCFVRIIIIFFLCSLVWSVILIVLWLIRIGK